VTRRKFFLTLRKGETSPQVQYSALVLYTLEHGNVVVT